MSKNFYAHMNAAMSWENFAAISPIISAFSLLIMVISLIMTNVNSEKQKYALESQLWMMRDEVRLVETLAKDGYIRVREDDGVITAKFFADKGYEKLVKGTIQDNKFYIQGHIYKE